MVFCVPQIKKASRGFSRQVTEFGGRRCPGGFAAQCFVGSSLIRWFSFMQGLCHAAWFAAFPLLWRGLKAFQVFCAAKAVMQFDAFRHRGGALQHFIRAGLFV
jgi:hypothetical protein